MHLSELKQFSQTAVAKIVTKGAMNSMLALTAIVVPICLLLVSFGKEGWEWVPAGLATFVVVATVFAFYWFMFKDPDRLQSEKYQLERYKIGLLGDDRLGRDQEEALLQQPPVANFLPTSTRSEKC